MTIRFRLLLALLVATLFAGCAVGPDPRREPPAAPAAWSAPLPHGGDAVQLAQWWADWRDPVLSRLIEDAGAANPHVAAAAARIAQARATVRGQTAVLLPSLDARASDIRSKGGMQADPSREGQEIRTRGASLDALWELDLFGGGRRAREASQARVAARGADWHEARVSLAAEVASQYVNLRSCELLATGYEVDAASRAETARLIDLKTSAGFEAPANAALSRASASEAHARLIQQRADCDLVVKALVELTGRDEPRLREDLAPGRATLPVPARFAIAGIPAGALAQRPDLAALERELAAAMADIGFAIADRLPRLTLTGSIGTTQLSPGGVGEGRSWSFGPALSLPVFDFGRRAANVDAARARRDEAAARYQAGARRAVREVEEALVRFDSAHRREADANAALEGYRTFLAAAEARVRTGAGSLPELEEARRSLVAAQGVAVAVARERLAAWVALYKAVGGGWSAAGMTETMAETIASKDGK